MDAEDLRGFREFVDHRSSALLTTAVLLCGGDRHAGEDLLQNALVKAVGKWRRIEDPEAYVRRILYRQQISRWRLKWPRREVSVPEPPEGATTGGDTESLVETRLLMGQALAALTDRQRTVLVLRYYEDLPEGDVARLLGCSVGTVRSTTHRSLAKLRTLMPEAGDGRTRRPATEFSVVEVRP
ncbi:SigE family RNA polymerase sigma factor [Streptomyces abyssomicinicus]|uniref:SigE family RNA polymerase sigma factor n=1 Tax=Streptomyces abyssomicinicus TaxID=574929 RepID=UPI00124F86BE|nr:SigE family RNA polymerase sigma factor [Streptomyces abyssomicinicus]